MNAGEAKAKLRLVSSNTETEPTPIPSTPAPTDTGRPDTDPKKAMIRTNGKWARYAGKLGGALGVTASAGMVRWGGHDPHEPDDEDVVYLQEAIEEGLRLKYGDGDIPLWLGGLLAFGGLYASMRIGAPKLNRNPRGEMVQDDGTDPESEDHERQTMERHGSFSARTEQRQAEEQPEQPSEPSKFAAIRPKEMSSGEADEPAKTGRFNFGKIRPKEMGNGGSMNGPKAWKKPLN